MINLYDKYHKYHNSLSITNLGPSASFTYPVLLGNPFGTAEPWFLKRVTFAMGQWDNKNREFNSTISIQKAIENCHL